MSWTCEVTPAARRDIKRLDKQAQRRIADALERLAETHPQSANVIKLQDVAPPEYRLRVGEWRVRFRTDTAARVIMVLRVLTRGKAYER